MNENDWKQQVRAWVQGRRKSTPDLAEATVEFFAHVFENTRFPEHAWFGFHNSAVSLVTGGIFLAAVSSSGEIWFLADKNPPPIEGLDYRSVRSTKNSITPLVWIHATDFKALGTINRESQIWQTFALASEKIFNSPIARSRDDSFQQTRGKKRLSDFWKEMDSKKITLPAEVSKATVSRENSVRPGTVNACERNPETLEAETLDVTWNGPFSWPGFESASNLRPIPRIPSGGVYLQTFEYQSGYLIYGAGYTNGAYAKRFSAHTRHFMKGEYNVLDINAAQQGKREEIWHGWDYARKHPEEFEERKLVILDAVGRQLAGFHIFVTDLGIQPRRILARFESAIMNKLYQQPEFCEIHDEGMNLSKRWYSENPIIVKNNCAFVLHGLPAFLEI